MPNINIQDPKKLDPKLLDDNSKLKEFRRRFLIPKKDGKDTIYLCGNSLGVQPRDSKKFLEEELDKWAAEGVEGHFLGDHPWVTYDEVCVPEMATLVGAKDIEVVVMNSLPINMRMMLTTFYTPTTGRFKMLVDESINLPLDIMAILAQNAPSISIENEALVRLKPRSGEYNLRTLDILEAIDREEDTLACIFLSGVNGYTGQLLDMQAITKKAHSVGCTIGFDLSHAVGNVKLELHEWGPDFAVWSTHRYLFAGPAGTGGCFVHERHAENPQLPRFSGWWSHKKESRFEMKGQLQLRPGALGFQVSNPCIINLAAMRAGLQILNEVGMEAFREESIKLTGYLETLLRNRISGKTAEIITSSKASERGCQISIIVARASEVIVELRKVGILANYQEPDCITLAPNPLYNGYQDVFDFVETFSKVISAF